MPRVKLNTTDGMIAIKKRVIRANKKKYAGTDKMMPLEMERITGIYTGVYERLTASIAAIGEINAQLNLTAGINAPWASKAIDRYISATSTAKKTIAELNTYLEQHIVELGSLNDAQVTQLSASQQELTTTFKEIVENVSKLSASRQDAIKKVFKVFVNDLVKLNELLQANIGYKKTIDTLPVDVFKKATQLNPEQEQDTPQKPRKIRSDKGVKRKPLAAGDDEGEMSGSGCCCERIIGGSYGERIIGGQYGRRMPMLFPSAEMPEMDGAYLETKDYMPTRFL